MVRGSKEFYEMMDFFERDAAKRLFYGHEVKRYARDEKVPADQFYTDGFVNQMFLAFMAGYSLHESISNLE
jgi:hypothetical protein